MAISSGEECNGFMRVKNSQEIFAPLKTEIEDNKKT